MRAVKNTEAGITVVDVDEPEVRTPSDGVIVHVKGSGICGSDLKMAGFGPLEFVLGHEFSGFLDDGTAVAVDPGNPCGVCAPCLGTLRHLCNDNPMLGVSADGGLAERVLVKPEALVRLPSGLPVEYGCLVEPLAVSVHGLEVAGIRGGERVAVVGAGSIGLTAAAAAVVAGAEVAVEARHASQHAAAERLGATGTPTGTFDVVFEAAGTQSALDRAVELVRPAGTVVFLSTLWDPVALPGIPAMMKEITIKWAFTYAQHGGGRDLDTAAALLARRPEIAETVITHRFPLADAPAAFATAADRAHGAIKIMLEPE